MVERVADRLTAALLTRWARATFWVAVIGGPVAWQLTGARWVAVVTILGVALPIAVAHVVLSAYWIRKLGGRRG